MPEDVAPALETKFAVLVTLLTAVPVTVTKFPALVVNAPTVRVNVPETAKAPPANMTPLVLAIVALETVLVTGISWFSGYTGVV